MFEQVKIGLGRHCGIFYENLVATTKQLVEYKKRGLSKSIVFAPARMIDHAEEMLGAWQRNKTESDPYEPFKLPIIVLAIAQDYTPTGRDFSIQIADSQKVLICEDDKERVFGIRTIVADLRFQFAIFAQDEPTSKSLAAQLSLFLDTNGYKRFKAQYEFANMMLEFPVQIFEGENQLSAVETENKNVTILALDIVAKSTVPLFDSPSNGEPTDGNATTNGSNENPHGYPVVIKVNSSYEGNGYESDSNTN